MGCGLAVAIDSTQDMPFHMWCPGDVFRVELVGVAGNQLLPKYLINSGLDFEPSELHQESLGFFAFGFG